LLIAETWAMLAAALFVISPWRLTVRRPPPARVGTRVAVLVPTFNRSMRVAFELDGRRVDVAGTVARCESRGSGEFMVGLTFDELDSGTRGAVVSWVFRRPFGPDVPVGVEPEPVARPAARRVS